MSDSPDPRSILLVEGDPDDRARLHRFLGEQRRRYAITECATGKEAVRRIRDELARIDCVVLDYDLPDMDGVEVLQAVRGPTGVPLPVSMLMGQDDDVIAARVLEAGAEDYLVKDALTQHALTRSIENVIEKFSIRRQLEAQRAALALRTTRLEALRDKLSVHSRELTTATRTRDRFMAMMSHEMRTPLNAILGYAELLELEVEGELNEAQRRYLERIRVGSSHLLALINDVLDLSRADIGALELDLRPVNVANIVEEVAALLEHQAVKKGLSLHASVSPEPLLANVDLQRTRQIVMNLLGNAIKFTDVGGVTVRVKSVDDGTRVAVEVEDTGIGIDADTLPLIFNEFYQANSALTRAYGGSGLGLAISQRLARAMGGDVVATSEPGRGSTFTVVLPTAAAGSRTRSEDTEEHSARMAMHAVPRGREERGHVPVAAFGDDAESLERLAQHVRPGVRLVWTTDASQLKEIVARERASLVILDASSRDGAAWGAAHLLSEGGLASLPAILLLPSLQVEAGTDASGGVSLGWVSLIPKPFTAEQLTRAVSAAAHRTAANSPSGYEVLVIDDDPDSRRVARNFLSRQGIRVRECTDGERGLVEMREGPPDVVVLDLMMPVLDGFGVLAAMRADPLLSDIPVVVLTAKSLTEAERTFLSRTAERVLQKGQHRLADVAALVLRAAMQSRQNVRAP